MSLERLYKVIYEELNHAQTHSPRTDPMDRPATMRDVYALGRIIARVIEQIHDTTPRRTELEPTPEQDEYFKKCEHNAQDIIYRMLQGPVSINDFEVLRQSVGYVCETTDKTFDEVWQHYMTQAIMDRPTTGD